MSRHNFHQSITPQIVLESQILDDSQSQNLTLPSMTSLHVTHNHIVTLPTAHSKLNLMMAVKKKKTQRSGKANNPPQKIIDSGWEEFDF